METGLGVIIMMASNFAPRGYALCNGQCIQIRTNTALFSIIGTSYGGDGRLNFAVPDFRGRFPTQYGTGPGLPSRRLGIPFGKENIPLTEYTMPAHSHTATVTNGQLSVGGTKGTTTGAANNYLGNAASTDPFYRTSAGTGFIGGLDVQVTNANTGSGAPFDILNPGLPVLFAISTTGIFPTRG